MKKLRSEIEEILSQVCDLDYHYKRGFDDTKKATNDLKALFKKTMEEVIGADETIKDYQDVLRANNGEITEMDLIDLIRERNQAKAEIRKRLKKI